MKLFSILGEVPNYEKWLILNELLNIYCVFKNKEELVAERKTRSGTGCSAKIAQHTSKVEYFYHLFLYYYRMMLTLHSKILSM